MSKLSSRTAVVIGVVAIVAAATLRFAIVPAQAQLPADTDTSRQYQGTVEVILDAEALAAGDLANALMRDIPVTLDRTTTVTGVEGGNASVLETGNVVAPDGTVLAGYETNYVVDRRTMQGQGDRSGLVMGWPIGAEARDYVGWSSDLQAEVELTYQRTEDFQGIEALVFTSEVQGRIVDEATLANFPASLPKLVLPMVAGALDVPDAVAAQLPNFLQVLPDEVPLAYLLDSQSTYWVDPATGMVLDIDRTESRQVAFDVDSVPMIGLADVYAISYSGTDSSVTATVDEAVANGRLLFVVGTALPAILLVIGLAALAIAARRRRSDVVLIPSTTSADSQAATGPSPADGAADSEYADA